MDRIHIWRTPGPILAVAAVLGVSGSAAGQNSWVIQVEYSDPAGVINSPDDTATINLWAAWDPAQYAFDEATLSMTAADALGGGVWSDPKRLLKGPGSKDGTIEGETVSGIVPSQFLDTFGGIFPDTSNPIAVWTATWQTSDLKPRDAPVVTETSEFSLWVFDNDLQDWYWDSFIDSLSEGVATITIVPAPGVTAIVGLGCLIGARRGARTVTIFGQNPESCGI